MHNDTAQWCMHLHTFTNLHGQTNLRAYCIWNLKCIQTEHNLSYSSDPQCMYYIWNWIFETIITFISHLLVEVPVYWVLDIVVGVRGEEEGNWAVAWLGNGTATILQRLREGQGRGSEWKGRSSEEGKGQEEVQGEGRGWEVDKWKKRMKRDTIKLLEKEYHVHILDSSVNMKSLWAHIIDSQPD